MAKKQSKDKTYKYVTRTVTLPNGKRKYVYGKTKQEAEEKLAQLKADLRLGVKVDDDSTFGEVAKIWLEQYKAPYVRESTVYMIRAMFNKRIMPVLADMPVKDITPYQIQSLFSDITNEGYTGASHILSCLREIFDVAKDLGCIAVNPVPATLKPARPGPKKERQIIPEEVDAHLLEALPQYTPQRMFYMIGSRTGLRRGEILALNWSNLDLDNDILKVRGTLSMDENGRLARSKVTKTESGLREVPIPDDLHDELEAWMEKFGKTMAPGHKKKHLPVRSDGYLFVLDDCACYQHGYVDRMWKSIQAIAAEVDPEFSAQFTTHTMRHTYITRLFEAGLDIKEIQTLAGHKDVQTTLNVYTHYSKEERQERTFANVRNVFNKKQDGPEKPGNIIAFPAPKRKVTAL